MPEPERRFKVGACTASVFANEVNTADGPKQVRTVSLRRAYMDKHGSFQFTTNFKMNDIPKAILVLNKAYDYLTLEKAGKGDAPREH